MVSVGLLGLKRAVIILPVAYTGAWLGYYGESAVWLSKRTIARQSSLDRLLSHVVDKGFPKHYLSDITSSEQMGRLVDRY
jgi:hypothetical protein